MTPALAKKIALVSGLIPSLKKGTRNSEAGFNYVSIDDYYDQVASVLRENGLIWTVTEQDCVFKELGGETYARYRYLFNLFDVDDTTTDVDGLGVLGRTAVELSMIHPLQDAQTTGSAMSYAEKLFLRTMFKVVTGEPDADAFARKRAKLASPKALKQAEQNLAENDDPFEQAPPQPAASRRVEAKRVEPVKAQQSEPFEEIGDVPRIGDDQNLPPPSDAIMIEAKCNVVIGALNTVKTKTELNDWKRKYEDNGMIEAIKSSPSDQYARLQGAFAEKLAELKGKKKGA